MPYKGLSSMLGNQHVLFLGEPQLVTAVAYPAQLELRPELPIKTYLFIYNFK